jgi:hypothetical protein
MSNIQRLEDLLPDWRKACAERVGATAEAVAQEATALPPARPAEEPARRAALASAVHDAAVRLAAEDLLPAALDFLAGQGLGPPAAALGRVRAEAASALRQRIPNFEPRLPPPTYRLPYLSLAVAAAVGGVLCLLALAPLSLLVLGQREPGLFVGGPLGALLSVALLAWLAQRPKILQALQTVVGVATVLAALGAVVQYFRRQSKGWFGAAAWIAGCWLLLLTVRPRLTPPTRDECREALRPQVERLLAHVVDLVLAICWAHPERCPPPKPTPSAAAGLPPALAEALGVLSAVADEEAPEKHLRGAVRAVLQRVHGEGYEWRSVPAGTPYDASLEAHFDCFDRVTVGQPVETLEPAFVRNGELVKRGTLRSL